MEELSPKHASATLFLCQILDCSIKFGYQCFFPGLFGIVLLLDYISCYCAEFLVFVYCYVKLLCQIPCVCNVLAINSYHSHSESRIDNSGPPSNIVGGGNAY